MILVNIVRYPGDRTRESGDVLALISMLLHCQISQLITYAGGGVGEGVMKTVAPQGKFSKNF